MLLADLFEATDQDVSMSDMATEAARLVNTYVYNHKDFDFEITLRGRRLHGLYGETVGFDERFGFDHILLLFGAVQPNTRGYSGSVVNFHPPIEDRYTSGIIVYCGRSDDPEDLRKAIGTTQFVEVFAHEVIHILDEIRSKGKALPRYKTAQNREKYFNDPGEFNAFFHNVADKLLGFLRDAKQATPEEIHDLADIYDIDRDFSKTLAAILPGRSVTREFIKTLNNDRRKALLKRLYRLHQDAVKLLSPVGITEARRPFLLRPISAEAGREADIPVYENPSPAMVAKLVPPQSAQRAIIYRDGPLYLWHGDLVHSDVREQLARGVESLSLYLTPTEIFVWGDEHQEGKPFTDQAWLAVLEANPTIRRTYGDDITVTYDCWI